MNEAKQYRSKVVTIQAVVWDGESGTANAFLGERFGVDWEYAPNSDAIIIPTLEGRMRGEVGDYIVRGLKGEFYPVKPDIFAMKYDAVDATPCEGCGSPSVGRSADDVPLCAECGTAMDEAAD